MTNVFFRKYFEIRICTTGKKIIQTWENFKLG